MPFKLFKRSDETMVREKEINTNLIELMQKHNVPAAGYAIIDKYEIVLAKTLSTHAEIQASQNSLFQACSLSKPITAYVALLLQDTGEIDIDKPINSQLNTWHIPGGEHYDIINLRQCLSMTSGLTYGKPNSTLPDYTQDMAIPELRDILNGTPPATNGPVTSSSIPGSAYAYSGAGFMIAQKLIEDVKNKSFRDVSHLKVFTPLGMNSSTFACPLPEEMKKYVVPGFNANSEMNHNGWYNIPSSASGGLWSTPTDLAKFILAISNAYRGKNNDLLSKQLASEMLTQQKNTSFGLGFDIDGCNETLNFRKIGYNNGYCNQLIMFPNKGKGIVLMTNYASAQNFIKEFFTFIADLHQWPQYSSNFDEVRKKDPMIQTPSPRR